MNQAKAFIASLVFAIQVLIVFLLLFESKVAIPTLLQPLGRMHPLLLHLPIGFLLLLAIFPLLKKEISPTAFQKARSFILHLAALTASGTALIGFFLAQEEGYETDLVIWHKWTGVAVSFVTYGLLVWHEKWSDRLKGFHIATIANTALLLWAGHLGGSITHGEDYVLAPLQKEEQVKITPQTPVFVAAIVPILEAKCYQCHNERKSKGELIMTSIEELMQGGKNGAIWMAGNPDSSQMMQRIYLPLEEEEHMPPKGKSQLSDQEIELLHLWIASGANTEQRLEEVETTDILYPFINQLLQEKEITPTYAFNFANKELIEQLNTPFRNVSMFSLNSPALHAEIFVRKAYKKEFLQELLAVKEQLISLNISNLPIEDADLKTIAQFSNLEKLLLNNTDITGENLEELKACAKLNHLALSGTAVKEKHLQVLADFPALKEVYLWNTDIPTTAIDSLNKAFPNLIFERGYVVNKDEVLQLSPQRLKNKSNLLREGEQVVLESKFPNVTIRYTTDGSEPDSLNSPIYEQAFTIESSTVVNAKAFVEGWSSSEIATFSLFLEGYTPDSVKLLTDANPQYQGKGAETLINFEKGKAENFNNPAWLGYRDHPLEAVVDFGKNPPEIKEIVGSFAQNLGSEIFPPEKIEIWGGNNQNALNFLSSAKSTMPTTYESNEIVSVAVNLPNSKFQYYKIIVHPTQTLKWHNLYKKGRKGWAFIDEVFFY